MDATRSLPRWPLIAALTLGMLFGAGCGSSHSADAGTGTDAGPNDSSAPLDAGGGCRPDGPACSPGQYCELEDGCDFSGETGTCAPRPMDCPTVFAPVCGCDDQTYGNACAAAAAGVNVLRTGACEMECTAETPCTDSLQACTGTCGEAWVCMFEEVCSGDLAPFCSCDGVTFMDSSTCPSRPYQARGECPPATPVSCDPSPVTCRRVMPTCPGGEVPAVERMCWGPCVPLGQCACTGDDQCPVGRCAGDRCTE